MTEQSVATIEETDVAACPRAEIAAYIDGELTPGEELALELHLAGCPDCAEELNLQKQMLRALDCGLKDKAEIELPKDFARTVAARAESGVSGLRSREERFRALFLCALLFLIVLVGLGAAGTGNLLSASGKALEQTVAALSFVGHLAFHLAMGVTIILRSLFGQFVFSSAFSQAAAVFLFALSALLLSRLISRYHRQRRRS